MVEPLRDYNPSPPHAKDTPGHMSACSTTGNEHARARDMNPAPIGMRHLHLTCPSGRWVWSVRRGNNVNGICDTDRCVPVTVLLQRLARSVD